MPHLRAHSRAVFDNNALLAQAMAKTNRLFAFARPDCAWANAPYSIARLPNADVSDYRQLESILTREADRRGIQFDHGGSFGFRFHRFEAVIPSDGMGEPYLRVAMGARPGPSLQGVVDLMCEVAAAPNLVSLTKRYSS